jgi:hypothetical protein
MLGKSINIYSMMVFSDTIDDILNSLEVQPEMPSADGQFDRFKQFVVQYVAEHDSLEVDSPAVQQLVNSTDIDQLESFLRQNLDYCDDCMLKLYRRYVLNG